MTHTPTNTMTHTPTNTMTHSTTSLDFAREHQKRHWNVVRIIDRELSKADSELSSEVLKSTREVPVANGAIRSFSLYHLTRRAEEILEQKMWSVPSGTRQTTNQNTQEET